MVQLDQWHARSARGILNLQRAGYKADVTPPILLRCGAGWQTGGGLFTRLQTA